MHGFLILILLIGLVGGVTYLSLAPVPEGQVGIATLAIPSFGSAPRPVRLLTPGLHFTCPGVTHVRLYNTRVQMLYVDVPLNTGSTFRLTAQVRLDSDSAVSIHQRLGPGYLREVVRPTLSAILERELYASGGAVDDPIIQDRIRDTLRQSLSIEGLHLDEAVLTRFDRVTLIDERSDTDEPEN